MRYLDAIAKTAASNPDRTAIVTTSGDTATYGWLWSASEALAAWIDASGVPEHEPVMVYGHKSPLHIACMHACLKSGHPYVPVDRFSVPKERAVSIAGQIGAPLVLATSEFPEELADAASTLLDTSRLTAIAEKGGASQPERWVSGEDLAYILFTSGSTGTPKGVQVTADCFDNFLGWAVTLGGIDKAGLTFLNQAPFSFDLSVYELAMALASGGTLFCLTKQVQDNMREEFKALAASGVGVWVSTPSFANMCLVDDSFTQELLPDLRLFLFCGETLANSTAAALLERFPQAKVVNSYGPTESTVAVAAVDVTPEMAAADEPLPVGIARPGTRLRVVDEQGAECPTGTYGEVIIEGDTVSAGYFKRMDLTEKSFGTALLDGKEVRTYRTGDEGALDEQGLLHYHGRLDMQVKFNGYRIELGDIEENIRKLPEVTDACVTPFERDGRIAYLVAHVVLGKAPAETGLKATVAFKKELAATLPHYMIPRKFVFHDRLPMTPNGKVDRKTLAKL